VGRPESPLDPDAGTVQRFAHQLRELREEAGKPTYRAMAKKAGYTGSTLSEAAAGERLPSLPVVLAYVAACDGDVVEWEARWHAAVREEQEQPRVDDGSPAPYVGLGRFQPGDRDRFFGRARLTADLVRLGGAHRLVGLVGMSGSGKSSLLRAGLIPAVQEGTAPVGRPAALRILTPGERPATTHASVLAAAEGAGDTWVLVDQFEEVFTLCQDPRERADFIDGLLTALETGSRLRVVIAIRADFYGRCGEHQDLAQALQKATLLVTPMSREELREAVVKPAATRGLVVERALAARVVEEVADEPGGLPLLSHALLETWRRRRGKTLTLQGYEAAGGLHGAIARTAEDVYTRLEPAQADQARRLLLRLITPGEGTPDTRRPVERTELEATGRQETTQILERLAQARLLTLDDNSVELAHEALITAWPRLHGWIEEDRDRLRAHRKLTEAAAAWAELGRETGSLYRGRRLVAAQEYFSNSSCDDLTELERTFLTASLAAREEEERAVARTARRLRWLAVALAALLVVSVGATVYSIQQQTTAERERNFAISRQIAGTANRLADSDPALAAQLAVAAYRISPTVEATSSLLRAASRPAVTRMVRPGGARQAVAVSPDGTLLAAGGADDTDTTVLLWDTRDSRRPRMLSSRLTGHTGAIYAVAFSSDGATMATGSADNTVRLWDVRDRTRPRPLGQPLTGPTDRVLAVEFTPDGAFLAAGSGDTTVRLWDVRDRARPVPAGPILTEATGDVQSITFSPAGDVMAVADADGAVRVWAVGDRRRPQPLGAPLSVPSRVNAVAFSPDGTTLAAGSNDAFVRLWTMTTNPARPTPAGKLTGLTGWINAITFSSDGKQVAAANASARVQVWDIATRQMRLDLPHTEPATAVAFREGDRVLYTNGADGVARRWLVPGPVLPTEDRQITGLAFHPERPLLIDGGINTQLWDLTNRDHPTPLGLPLTAPPDSDRMTGNITLSPDGNTLAGATRAGNIILLWDITDPRRPGQHPTRLAGHTALIEHVRFSPNGRLLASTSDDGSVRLWDTADAREPAALATLKPGTGFVYAAAFSPNSQTLIAVTQGGYIALWDIRDPRRPRALGKPRRVAPDDARSLAISPDNRTLAVGVQNGTVLLWDIGDPRTPKRLGPTVTGPDGIVHALTFSPDGTALAGGAGTGQTWLWRVTEQRVLDPIAILQGKMTTTWTIQFSSDGHTLASAVGDIHLWESDPDRAIQRVCKHTGDHITQAEWDKNIPDEPYRNIC
jgi:WD40 repeat protein/transcriptional regulator with XRE-family HTH domain